MHFFIPRVVTLSMQVLLVTVFQPQILKNQRNLLKVIFTPAMCLERLLWDFKGKKTSAN